MKEAHSDLGVARELRPETHGPPGRRSFTLVIEAEKGSAVVRMEKEQLSALALTIRRLLEELPNDDPGSATITAHPPMEPNFDFKASNLGLAYDEDRHLVGILAYSSDDATSEQPTITCWTSLSNARKLADTALELVARGIKSNGHRPFDEEIAPSQG